MISLEDAKELTKKCVMKLMTITRTVNTTTVATPVSYSLSSFKQSLLLRSHLVVSLSYSNVGFRNASPVFPWHSVWNNPCSISFFLLLFMSFILSPRHQTNLDVIQFTASLLNFIFSLFLTPSPGIFPGKYFILPLLSQPHCRPDVPRCHGYLNVLVTR